jgi:hypothetical protein
VQAAIELLPLYGSHALDDPTRQRDVMRINEQVYRLAFDQSNTAGYQAMQLYLENGIDIERAVLHDRRLPAAHLETRLPQLSHQLAQRRTEALKRWRQNAPGPTVKKDQGPDNTSSVHGSDRVR